MYLQQPPENQDDAFLMILFGLALILMSVALSSL